MNIKGDMNINLPLQEMIARAPIPVDTYEPMIPDSIL